jgi:hypothetical protein
MTTPSGDSRSRARRPAKYVVVLLVAAGCAPAALIVYPKVANDRRDRACKSNLQRLGAALHAYHELYDSFPPAYVLGEKGEHWHSWRVLLLPQLGHAELFAQYRFDEPWNGPHNRKLLDQMPEVYGCPADRDRDKGLTNYFALVGTQTMWPEQYATAYRQIRDGTSSTVCLIESVDEGIAWLEPRDLNYAEMRKRFRSNPRPLLKHTAGMQVLMASGDVLTISRDAEAKLFRMLSTARSGEPYPGVRWDLPADEAAEIQTTPQPASEMPGTTVTPLLDSSIAAGRNSIYCATLQLAWDRLKDVAKGPIELEGAPEIALALNREVFSTKALAEEAYVAIAGRTSEGVFDRIRSEMATKFPAAGERLVPSGDPGVPGVAAYAYLQKRLPFLHHFDRLEKPLRFHAEAGDSPVAAFGIEKFDSHDPHEGDLREQVKVLDYVDREDFIIELRPQRDYIVLAKIPRPATLAEAVASVQSRIDKPRGRDVAWRLGVEERVEIPLLSLFVEREYTELIGRQVLNPGIAYGPVVEATQLIRFQLDESGAILESEMELQVANGDSAPPQPRRFILDRPFLIYLYQRDAKEPYFVMWVENAEVLVPFDKPAPG